MQANFKIFLGVIMLTLVVLLLVTLALEGGAKGVGNNIRHIAGGSAASIVPVALMAALALSIIIALTMKLMNRQPR